MSQFSIRRDYLNRKGFHLNEQNRPDESMINSMKNRKTDIFETTKVEPDSSGFEDLFREHWAHVYRALVRLVGDPAEAEDLALETFFRLYQRYPRPPLPENGFNIGGWLHRVAINLGLHSIRSFKRREHYELNAGKGALEHASENRPSEILAQEEERQLTRQALAEMSERQAQLLVMRYSGMAYKDIAKTLGLAPTSIGPLLLRAEREFEKCYRALAQEE
jgi:RNA polymerase sigma factor (sigma-70 family)